MLHEKVGRMHAQRKNERENVRKTTIIGTQKVWILCSAYSKTATQNPTDIANHTERNKDKLRGEAVLTRLKKLDLEFKFIAYPFNCANIIISKLFAQFSDVHIDCSIANHNIISPNTF